MGNLLVDERDIEFVLCEQLNIEELCKTERHKGVVEIAEESLLHRSGSYS